MTAPGESAFQAAARRRRGELVKALGEVEAMRRRHDDQMRAVGARRDEALETLVRSLLPSLALEARRRVVELTAYHEIVDEDPLAALEDERAKLEARIARIEKDPRFRDAEQEAAWRADVRRQLDELEEFREPLAHVLDLTGHPRFARLMDLGFGTPAYAVPFWRLSYYRDREAAAELVGRFPGMHSFAEVREEYLAALENVAVYDGRRRELRAEIAAADVIVEELEDARQRLAGLAERHLEEWRGRLRRHLRDLGMAGLGFRFLDAPGELLLLKRWSGLEHQIAYMDHLATWKLMEHESVVSGEIRRLDLDLTRRAEGLPDPETDPCDAMAARSSVVPHDVERSVARLRQTHDKLTRFDAYERARMDRDFLWWDLMTDRDPAGDTIPEVAAHRQAHRS